MEIIDKYKQKVRGQIPRSYEFDPNFVGPRSPLGQEYINDYNRGYAYDTRMPDLDFSLIGKMADVAGTVSSSVTESLMVPFNLPKGHIGSAGSEALWVLEQTAPIVEVIAPEQTAVKAYDDYLCINGYYQDGRIIDLSGSKFMPRQNFSYVKTVNANINGPLGIYKSAIESAFNSGIRFWNKDLVGAGLVGNYQDAIITGNTPR